MRDGRTEAQSSSATDRRSWQWLVWLGVFVVLIGGGYLLWTKVLYPHYPARYKLTIEVETPQGLKTGFSVIEPVYGWEPTLFGLTKGRDNSITGEAVFVDLGGGRNLVVTLSNELSGRSSDPNKTEGVYKAMYLVSGVYGFPSHHKPGTRKGIEAARKSGPLQVPLESLPTTVTFEDLTDFRTMKGVDTRNITTTFGPGYKLRRATIEMTDEPLTEQLSRHIPWLNSWVDCGSITGISRQIICSGALKKVDGKQ